MPRMFCIENSTLHLKIEGSGQDPVALTHYWADNVFDDLSYDDDGHMISTEPLCHTLHIMRDTEDMAVMESWLEQVSAQGDDCDWRGDMTLTSPALRVTYRCTGGRLVGMGTPSYRDDPHHFLLHWDKVIALPYRASSRAGSVSDNLQIVPLQDCLTLRHNVLWPNAPLAASRVEGDEEALHYGIRVDGQLICCLSVFKLGDDLYQIRKFATDSAYQGQGYGSRLLTSVLASLGTSGKVVLDARLSAQGFYTKFGFSAQGDVFNKSDVAYIRMAKALSS